jgi:hypothetical protein
MAMVRIKVEYDKYTRAFKLLDREFGSVLEDGAQYELVLPLEFEVEKEDEANMCIRASLLAHA